MPDLIRHPVLWWNPRLHGIEESRDLSAAVI